ncbi:hypothetical protein BGZ70_009103 [Mortierella alpina]|uniref:GLTSCR protein conserved domain-containing protein n=1 Tax=Mortierella alpina TaxID=64518 RepID=A0A9P6M134_MORAP|nr:hypothetical protein BGZ70_009103 [Mortierella alpina]
MATPSTPPTATAAVSPNDTETVTHIQMAGLTVLMIRKKDQVIYKLPDNMSVQSLSQDQRERLLAEINLLHHQQTTAQALAATQAQTQQVQLAQAQALAASQGVRPIAPSGHVNGNVSQAGSRASSTPSTPNGGNIPDSQQKTTRRYNKTGKYSKKKLMQQQMLDRQADGQGARPASGEPYPRPQDKLRLQQQQPLVFNSSSTQAYQPIAAATPSTDLASTAIQSSFLQQQLQNQQVSGVASVDHKKQLKLLQEIHELQKQIEAQQATADTFREHEQTIKRMLAHNKPVDAKTQQGARNSMAEAERTLEKLKDQLKEKESTFREQYPVASQQLLLLQQQQMQAAAAARLGSGLSQSPGGGSLTSRSGATVAGMQRAVTDPLQQKIAEHHLAVRNAMTSELEETHRALRRPDWWTPFKSFQDAMERLIPFHVFQYPAEDLEVHATAFTEMNARALAIHRRKEELFQRYNDTIKKGAAKATNPSSALEIYALRHSLEDEQTECRKISGEHEQVANETKVFREELERRQVQLLQQRRTEAALIEAQQKLMLERQRQEELEKQQEEARQRQMQELQLQQRLEEMQEMQQHLQQQQQDFQSLQQHQQDVQSLQQHHHHQLQQQEPPAAAQGSVLTAEEEEARRKGEERKELERTHQLELEKQLRIKQDHQQEEEQAARAAAQAASQALAASNASTSTAPGRS